jgi:hypothetical protein
VRADFQAESKWPFLWGFPPLWSPVTFAVSQADLGHPSLHPKIPFPRNGVAVGMGRSGTRESWEFFGPKRTFRARSVLIAGSIRGLRTDGSIVICLDLLDGGRVRWLRRLLTSAEQLGDPHAHRHARSAPGSLFDRLRV